MVKSATVLRDYQKEAIDRWIENNFTGLFEMATGTGKTITALNCAKYLLEKEKKLQLIILVPTLDLAEQWRKEVNDQLFRNIISANSRNKEWYQEAVLAVNTKNGSFCIITTYSTFLTKRFTAIMLQISEKAMIIADEVHNFGTKKHHGLYPIHVQRRLGLSATPDRYFDQEGTDRIFNYFGVKNGPTFKFTMGNAIQEGYLCEYYYYPMVVTLTNDETEEYKAISIKLLKYFNHSGQSFKDNPIVNSLLLKRKRIIHNAFGKFTAFRTILSDLKRERNVINYVLVYVPEGNDEKIDDEDKKLINTYSKITATEFGLSQYQFIGLTTNRQKILTEFSKGSISVLTAMKCLDEGIDIKRAEIAIFCSSTGNPRQFIQRRGRILRTHPDKKFAVIYDLIVVPALTNQYFESTLQMEKSILRNELRRVHEFAELSLNHYQALSTLEEVAKEFDLDIYSRL